MDGGNQNNHMNDLDTAEINQQDPLSLFQENVDLKKALNFLKGALEEKKSNKNSKNLNFKNEEKPTK